MLLVMRFFVPCILVLALMASGCVSGPEEAQPAPSTTSAQALAAPTSTTNKATSTTMVVAVDEEPVEPPTESLVKLPANITNCLTLENETVRDVCFYDAAGAAKDMAACDKIQGKNLQLKCRARIIDDPEYCDQVDALSQKDWCYRMMAFKWNKLEYCKAIYYQKVKDKCILDFVKDKVKRDFPKPYECFQIVDSGMRDDCIYYHIDLYNRTGSGIKPVLCNLINNESLELKCNQTYLGK